MFAAPFLGYMHEKFGRRAATSVLASLLFVLSIIVLQLHWSPTAAMLVFSLSLTIGPVALLSSIPLLVPPSTVGTALGAYKAAFWTGTTIFDLVVGRLQDIEGYDLVLLFFVVVGGCSVVFCAMVAFFGIERSFNARPAGAVPLVISLTVMVGSWVIFFLLFKQAT